MKYTKMAGLFLASILLVCSAGAQDQAKKETKPRMLQSSLDSIQYAAGLYIGSWIKENGLLPVYGKALFRKGLLDKLNGRVTEMRDSVAFDKVALFIQKAAAETSKKNERAFLKKLTATPGVGKLPNGVYFQEITKGQGVSPTSADSVVVNLKGETITHVKIADTYAPDQRPATLAVSGLVPGLADAITYMKEGAKWNIFIPSQLAYGEAGFAGIILPNQLLVFEVSLLRVKPASGAR